MRLFFRRRCFAVFVAFSLGLPAARAAQPEAAVDPVEGFWCGTIRSHNEVSIYGLEFKRNDAGELVAVQYVPESNINGYTMGTIRAEGNRYLGAYDLTRRGDLLEGSFAGGGLPLSLRRTDGPPSPHAPPRAPAGPAGVWSYTATGALWARPVVVEGIAYLGDIAGRLHAVDVADGSVRWTRETGGAIYGEVLASGDVLYVVNDAGLLLAFDRVSGVERWRFVLGGGDRLRRLPSREKDTEFDYAAPTPVLVDGVIYVGAIDGGFHAISATTGESVWRFEADGGIRATALVIGERVFFGTLKNHLVALDRANGKEVWRVDTGGQITTTPTLAAGNIVVGNRGYKLMAVRPDDGARVWEYFQWFSWVDSSPTVVDGVIYIGSSDQRKARALDPVDGGTQWATAIGGWAWAQPAVTDDAVYTCTVGMADAFNYAHPVEGSINALDRKTGELKWRIPVPMPSEAYLSGAAAGPVVTGDRLLVAGLDGVLRAYPLGR
jgi:outer membrane protein assembly factor BamB